MSLAGLLADDLVPKVDTLSQIISEYYDTLLLLELTDWWGNTVPHL